MVVALGPGKFYGSSLPRPRIYTDVKLNEERVDPPTPVTDPLLSWANEAHWSMGGLSFKRCRLQGKIEGNISKLRKQQEEKANAKEKERVSLPATAAHRLAFETESDHNDDDPPPKKKSRKLRVESSPESDDKSRTVAASERRAAGNSRLSKKKRMSEKKRSSPKK